ncbi:nitrogenase stabilizing/protective protein NifW [Prosthecomicrobium hirschii]|jgi:nitrogenase-stabilizing/protective protein|uniref:Nitrogenase-stabilizing/protective protein NifW n=1 Tax=Prosthecodimorpha hirschii TaxID=665126 RepID=A0A0P6VL76_9HYPH|nr:nitrogenase stabilizing/protective protein NifW [Prosthecomicrobium hirschii]KPL51942.1 nitrogen fixation protein NifW [Prosthecomicrobium hirschii]MCW1843704.1 nitrogenase stabilizing/protective protein NifW [Prosthecomicrobium hirschii]
MSCSLDDRPIDVTDILARLKRLSAAEEFFLALGVTFDPKVLQVARLHILKRMGEYLAGEDFDGLPDSVVAARAKAVLQRAYADFESSSPLRQRVFQVLKDHDPDRPVPPKTAFVALDDIMAPLPKG